MQIVDILFYNPYTFTRHVKLQLCAGYSIKFSQIGKL